MKTEWNADEIREGLNLILRDEKNRRVVYRGDDTADRLMAALTARKLRDDCPVLYDNGGCVGYMARARQVRPGDTNIRALIPEDTIIQKAKERDEYLKEFGGHRIHSDETYWTRVIDECKYGTNE